MIFPIHVGNRMKNAGKTTGPQKVSAIVILALLVNIGVFPVINNFLTQFKIPTVLGIITQFIATIIVGIIIIKVFVIREDDKLVEHEHSKDSSLSNYYYIRNKDNLEKIESAPIFEYTDSNFCVVLRLTYGSNSEKKSKGNETLLTSIFNKVLSYDMQVRIYTMPEDFSESVECKTYLNSMSSIDNDSLRSYSSDMINEVLRVTANYRELTTTTIFIKTSNPYQIGNMSPLLRHILREFSTSDTSFRSIEFFNQDSLRVFIRNYHCLEALDLSSLKANEVDSNTLLTFKDLVEISSITLSTGEEKVINLYKPNRKGVKNIV